MARKLPAVLLCVLAGCGASDDVETPSVAPDATFDPAPAQVRDQGRWRVARVMERTRLRGAPGGRSVATVGRRTEFGTRRVLSVVGQRGGWLEVIATERPNGRTGWIRARAVRESRVDWSIEVDRSRRRARLLRGGRVVREFGVSVGRAGNETPLGRFAVTDRLRMGRARGVYGCCAVALSGHQPRIAAGWEGGDRLAIHGTPGDRAVGSASSLGCLRARRADLRVLMRRVPLGAPVFVRA